jgi:hypothetical protein
MVRPCSNLASKRGWGPKDRLRVIFDRQIRELPLAHFRLAPKADKTDAT